MTENDYKLRQAHIDWMLEHADALTHAITLTLKPYCVIPTERGEMRDTLTPIAASRNFHHFLRRLNKSVFGHAAQRYDKSVVVLPMLEGRRTDKLLHYHCAFGFPTFLQDAAIDAKVRCAWQQTQFGNEQIKIKRMATTGWLSYMGKDIRSTADELDISNVRLPSASLA